MWRGTNLVADVLMGKIPHLVLPHVGIAEMSRHDQAPSTAKHSKLKSVCQTTVQDGSPDWASTYDMPNNIDWLEQSTAHCSARLMSIECYASLPHRSCSPLSNRRKTRKHKKS